MPKEIISDVKTQARLLLLFLTLAGGAASAQADFVQACVGVKVPGNADLGCSGEASRHGRDSRKRASGDSCAAFEVPPSGYMDVSPRYAPRPGVFHDETWWTWWA